jgi:hypothetical protein
MIIIFFTHKLIYWFSIYEIILMIINNNNQIIYHHKIFYTKLIYLALNTQNPYIDLIYKKSYIWLLIHKTHILT